VCSSDLATTMPGIACQMRYDAEQMNFHLGGNARFKKLRPNMWAAMQALGVSVAPVCIDPAVLYYDRWKTLEAEVNALCSPTTQHENANYYKITRTEIQAGEQLCLVQATTLQGLQGQVEYAKFMHECGTFPPHTPPDRLTANIYAGIQAINNPIAPNEPDPIIGYLAEYRNALIDLHAEQEADINADADFDCPGCIEATERQDKYEKLLDETRPISQAGALARIEYLVMRQTEAGAVLEKTEPGIQLREILTMLPFLPA